MKVGRYTFFHHTSPRAGLMAARARPVGFQIWRLFVCCLLVLRVAHSLFQRLNQRIVSVAGADDKFKVRFMYRHA